MTEAVPIPERATTLCTLSAREIGEALMGQLGPEYSLQEVYRLAYAGRLVWEPTGNGVQWLLDGRVVLAWNELQLRFIKPTAEAGAEVTL
jgi:hypothetical protein